jgi:hypothetical protein
MHDKSSHTALMQAHLKHFCRLTWWGKHRSQTSPSRIGAGLAFGYRNRIWGGYAGAGTLSYRGWAGWCCCGNADVAAPPRIIRTESWVAQSSWDKRGSFALAAAPPPPPSPVRFCRCCCWRRFCCCEAEAVMYGGGEDERVGAKL